MPLAPHLSRPLVILGAGYTGRFLYSLATAQGWETYATSRTPKLNLPHIPQDRQIEFDLSRSTTWGNLPKGANVIWCFPAFDLEPASHFAQEHSTHGGRLVLLGSTSAYRPDPNHWIDEETPVNLSLPRVQTEEHLRTTCRAIVLRLAGLYGPGRHVLNWIRNGKVKHTNRYVNLIHIEDVAAICLCGIRKGSCGRTLSRQRWHASAMVRDFLHRSGTVGIANSSTFQPKDCGKRLSIRKLRSALNYTFQHPDLYEALDVIEQERRGE